jgi:hypothetical protein
MTYLQVWTRDYGNKPERSLLIIKNTSDYTLRAEEEFIVWWKNKDEKFTDYLV